MTLGKLIYALVKVKDDNDGNDEKQREEESADKFADDVAVNKSEADFPPALAYTRTAEWRLADGVMGYS